MPSIGTEKVTSYISAIAGAILPALFFALRFSVRLIADGPTELPDERLIAIRDRTYLSAYRWLSFVVGIVVGVRIARDFSFGVDHWGTSSWRSSCSSRACQAYSRLVAAVRRVVESPFANREID